MANKFNLDGFAVDTDNQCTAEGGFIGDLTGNVTGDLKCSTVIGDTEGATGVTVYSNSDPEVLPGPVLPGNVAISASDNIYINPIGDTNIGGGIFIVRTTGNDVLMPSLPTSDPEVAGQLWNNSGIVTVSGGPVG